MKRSTRAETGAATVAICEAGSYKTQNGREVSIRDSLAEAISETRLYSIHERLHTPELPANGRVQISVTSETTTQALRRMAQAPGGHLACLNFASARNPGGGFLGGAEAQEESLARSSGLYPCLLAAPEYYERNRAHRSALYLDLAIWSPGVPFIRDDEGALLDEPYAASVITAPAPNAGAVNRNEPENLSGIEPALRKRGEFVLRIAMAQSVRRLVLGAWGCGVFHNDPEIVAQVFGALLLTHPDYALAFDEVVFAIYDRSASQPVLQAFERVFQPNPSLTS